MIVIAEETGDSVPAKPAPPAMECIARLAAASGLPLLLSATWAPILENVANAAAKEVRILPRLSVFLCGLFVAMLLAGARFSSRQCCAAAIVLGLGAIQLQAGGDSLSTASLLLTTQLLALVFVGLALGGLLKSSGELLTLLACAVSGDIWLNALTVAEPGTPFALLRLALPTSAGHLVYAPGCGEILTCGILAGCARRLGLPLMSITLGAFAGYCAASFLGAPAWPAWTTLSVLLVTTGTLIACWPELDLGLNDLRRALLIGGLLMLTLALFSALRHQIAAPPRPDPEPFRYRSFT